MIKNSKLNIVFMGPPGVGKGTIASIISQKEHIVHLSTGNVFREEIASKSKLGLEISKIVESGQYVPDSITNEVVKNKLKALAQENKIVMLDGYPRTMDQVHFLDSIKDFNYVVIELQADKDLIMKRLSGRRACSQCKTNYHVNFMPSKKGEFCQECGSKLVQRKDDQPESIKVRQEVYLTQTEPLLSYYRKHDKLYVFDASEKPEITAQKIVNKIYN